MRTIPSPLLAHLAEDVTNLTVCWAVTRKDGVVIRGTQHDRNLTIASGTYAGTYLSSAAIRNSDISSGSDLSPDNSEVEGFATADAFLTDLSAADIEAGLFDDADLILIVCNWAAPDDGQFRIPGATLGNIQRVSEGKYTAEVRGLAQHLTQPILRTYSENCNADLGDARCGVDLTALIIPATVTAVTSRRRFDCFLLTDSSSGVAGDYVLGKVVGLTGANAGYTREVKQDAVGSVFGALELHEVLPIMPEIGDTFSLYPGCDKQKEGGCRRYNNIPRFRGYGVFTPTANKMIKGPDRGVGPA